MLYSLSGSNRGPGKQASQLPLTRVKNIIKSDPDITLASQEATLVISRVRILAIIFIVNDILLPGYRTVCATFVKAVSRIYCERKEKNYPEERRHCMFTTER